MVPDTRVRSRVRFSRDSFGAMTDPAVAPKSFLLSAELSGYLVGHGTPPDAIQLALIEETRELGAVSGMQIAPEQGAFLTLLTRLVGARSAVEVGTFTGYSSLCIARGLSADGHLLCCDVSDEWTSIARRAWDSAGVAARIELKLAPAADTLRALPAEETIDLAFIDADKPGYAVYYEEILSRHRRQHLGDPEVQRHGRRRRPRRSRDAPHRRRPHPLPQEIARKMTHVMGRSRALYVG
jgi:caffeoyl-CoA O-methyltransferase